MTPPIRLHDAIYIPNLQCLFFFGQTPRVDKPATLTVELKDGLEWRNTHQVGAQPINTASLGLIHEDIVFFESGFFYGLIPNIGKEDVSEVTAGYSGSSVVRRRPVAQVDWNSDQIALSQRVASDLDARSVDQLTRASQLRILALSSLVWMKRNGTKLGSIDHLRAAQVGEALRKSVMKPLSIALLSSSIPSPAKEADTAYSRRFDLLGDALEHNWASRDLCVQDIKTNGETSWSNTNMGHYHFGLKEIAQADGFYLQSSRFLQASGQRNIHYNNGVFTWRSHAYAEALEGLYDNDKPMELPAVDPAMESAKIVHLLGCDDGYFQKYGNMCIYSSLKAGHKDVVVHVHVCNPSDSTLETLKAWQARTDVNVRFSTEQKPADKVSVPYYTTLRFLIASAVMKHYNKPVVISDIDMVVNQPWADTLDAIEDADAGYISPTQSEWVTDHYAIGMRPWDVAAGTMYFSNSELGARFLSYVSTYIRTVLSFPKESEWYLNWGVDQVALRKGVDIVLAPQNAKVRNLRTVRMLRGPLMHMGGKAELAKEPAPRPTDDLKL
ncbi:hypothetical protein [Paenarthrobacter ilicis]|uniref:hypothetical protein n=1 Tax=Paenarthrobacter ilicis TaxID=43665 RepID=UPI0028D6DFC3|nr:hypothetical protein [Paenarthrobacter ilicis]